MTVAVATLLLIADPAVADPAGPTHFRSTVTAVEAADGDDVPVDVEVLGGDAYVRVQAEPGTLVEVPGYEGEPYLRFEPDGTVLVNDRSPARWVNDARFGEAEVDVPPQADADAPPDWRVVARDGAYAWHDHRIHFMSPVVPPNVDPAVAEIQPVRDWEVPLLVDGREVAASGELVWVPGPAPVVPIGAAGVAALAAAVAVWRRPTTVGALVAAGAVVTLAVGATLNLGLPAGADTDPPKLVLPLLALGLLATGRGLRFRGGQTGTLLTAAAGVPVLVWGVLLSGALVRPIPPGWLAMPVLRTAVAVALAVGVAALVALARAVVAATALDLDDEDDDADPSRTTTSTSLPPG